MCMSVGNNSFHTFLGLSEGNNMGWDWNLINKKTVYYCKKKSYFPEFSSALMCHVHSWKLLCKLCYIKYTGS